MAKRKANRHNGKHHTTQGSGKPKISESIWEFAGDFIRMGGTLEARQSLLYAACSAWNLACNMPELRKRHLDKYILEYRKHNPGADEEQVFEVRSNLEKLIEAKLTKFPNDLRQIVSARIFKVGDKERIEATAATFQ
jgi:hypothetical protein